MSGVSRKKARASLTPYETLKNFVGFANNSEFVMPDLIRHPEFAEVTGFRPSPE
jgi:hypothetical protein